MEFLETVIYEQWHNLAAFLGWIISVRIKSQLLECLLLEKFGKIDTSEEGCGDIVSIFFCDDRC